MNPVLVAARLARGWAFLYCDPGYLRVISRPGCSFAECVVAAADELYRVQARHAIN